MRNVKIFDTTLRDGEQSPGVTLHLQEKIEIAKQLEKLGVDIIEAGFPAASPGDKLSVKTISETVKNSSVTGLARCVTTDIDAAWEALKGGAEPRLHIFLATSPIHLKHKLKLSQEEAIAQAVSSIKYAKKYFPIVQWSAEDACRTDREFLARIVSEVVKAGANVVNIPDTVGFITPKQYGDLFMYLRNNVTGIENIDLSCHCHDDLGMAVANSLSAVEHGVSQIECTINGIGERAGNASLEEIAVALHIREDAYQAKTRIQLKEIKKTSILVSKYTGMLVPPNKAIVGKNAFRHESGIHQDGVLKEKTTYEIIDPSLVGVVEETLVLGKHSGRHAFKERLKDLGFDFNEIEIKDLFASFKELADKKKDITDEDLISLATEKTLHLEKEEFILENLQVHYGTNQLPTASITLKKSDGTIVQEAATGSGSVNVIYNTLEKCVGETIRLIDYRIQSVGEGRDALAEVYVKISSEDDLVVSGRGIDQDVIEASAKAYLNGVNRLNFMRQVDHLQQSALVENS